MDKWTKINSFFKENTYIDYIIITLIIIMLSFLMSNHMTAILIDHGREFHIPEQILNGKILYKDITHIYFPLAYYLNAFIFKLLGVSINSLIISQTIFCSLYINIFYMTAREFLSRKISLLITILVITSCIFAHSSFFNFITPYAYATTYGVMFFTLCTFFIIRLFKTDKIIYAYLTSITAGLTFCFKFEYYVTFLLLVTGLLLYKKLAVKQYIKIVLSFFIFPVLLLSFLLIQGATWQNLYDAIVFGIKFSKTPVMSLYLSETGMYPTQILKKLKFIAEFLPLLITIIVLCFTALKLDKKCGNKYLIPTLMALIIWHYFYHTFVIIFYWLILPIFVLILFLYNFKKLFYNSPNAILIIAGLLGSQRVLFSLFFGAYGTFAFPLLFLALIVILKHLLPEYIYSVKTKHLICYILIVLTGLYSYSIYTKYRETSYKLDFGNKGTLYTGEEEHKELTFLIQYIKKNISPNSTLLVLPEGNFLNYATGRNVDMHCFMLDRLYHDAYGSEKSKDMIAKTNSDYIILVKYGSLGSFNYPYLYENENSLAYIYIINNYTPIETYENNNNQYTILKRNE